MLILNGKIVLNIVFLTFILKAVPFKHISHPPKKGAVVVVLSKPRLSVIRTLNISDDRHQLHR
jgi:hypothetical protein